MTSPEAEPETIRIGVSACIVGQDVRYNGGHKLDRFIRNTLGAFVTFVPVCPEVELGLGVPRETLRLLRPSGRTKQVQLVAPKSGTKHTTAMLSYARKRVAELEEEALCGFIVQKGSPSCGMERVRIYPKMEGGAPSRDGRGLFTQVLMDRNPHLPVEEDGRLNDPLLRENFIVRVFAYRRLRTLFTPRWRLGDVVAFHAREKMLLLAHDRKGHTALGRMVAHAKELPRAQFKQDYMHSFLTILARKATRKKNANVMQVMSGHFKKHIDSDDRAELREVIESYRQRLVPLIVPITLIRHHVRKHGISYLAQQSFLDPHPRELMLRNHV